MARILIIDDQPANRAALVARLSGDSNVILAASDGLEGLALALLELPELIIAGLPLPTLDGYELARRIRASPDLSHTRLIFYTGDEPPAELRRLAANDRALSFLAKPATSETLLAAVNAALDSPLASAGASNPDLERANMRLLVRKLGRAVAELQAEQYARERAELLDQAHVQARDVKGGQRTPKGGFAG